MRLTKRARLLLVLMTVLSTGAFAFPVRGQSPADCSYPRVWDFSEGDYEGWTINTGTVTADGVESEAISGSTKVIDMTLMCAAPVGNPRQFLYGYWSSHGWTAPRPYNLYLLDENGDQIGGALGGGSGASGYGWFGTSGNWSAVYGFRIYYVRGISETFTVHYWEINHTTPVPTNTPVLTPTATPTATFTPTPVYNQPIAAPACIGLANGPSFSSGWTPQGGATINYGELSLEPGSSAYTTISIDASKQYDLRVYYSHFGAGAETDILRFNIGATSYILPMEVGYGVFDEVWTQNNVTLARYEFLGQFMRFEFAYAPGMLSNGLTVKWWCIREVAAGPPAIGAITDTYYEACFECLYEPEAYPDLLQAFNNIGKFFGWLWCSLRKFFECQLWVILGQLLQGLLDLLNFIKGAFEWLWETVTGAIEWVGSLIGQVLEWIVATGANIITGIGNLISGLWDFLSAFFTTIGLFIQALFEAVVTAIKIVIYVIDAVIRAVVVGVVAFVNWAAEIFGLGQVVVDGINSGFNRDVGDTISGSLACDNPSGLLYPVCLGFYVLDNTIFDGPGYWVFIVFIGVFSLDTLLWAVEKVRHGVLSQDA